ncbi:MAG: hypothetical protein AVDCRST_MAG72-293 [uncultured Nocardioidaceae bacterium]|uniref:Uncharacterized protein n=1 Tax=uncultured Nocardioidaceae bacterium TaxID=253824 RepID=A0A6J4LEL5_9ACTN|nr:MAG: hypothetical protein AVDCRST_MAG72-293 [uncultured Nocardioidaceae bacterium]
MAADRPSPQHQPPSGLDALTVEAVGRLTEALETTERARGQLYAFHQLTGQADFQLGDAVELLRRAGHDQIAARLADELVGRNVLDGRWSFQVLEEYDDGYWSAFRRLEQEVRDQLTDGRRHLHEAQLKEQRRSHGEPGHTARPQ